jgi:hypothetical protein
MADPARFELTTSAFGGQRSIQLSYGSGARNIAEGHRVRNAVDWLLQGQGAPAALRLPSDSLQGPSNAFMGFRRADRQAQEVSPR